MGEFTYQQNISSSSSLVPWVVGLAIAFAVVGLLFFVAGTLFKKRKDKTLFLQNQSFSRLVYNVSHNITGFDFEIWVKELFLSLGIPAETTPRFNDHGIDVIARYNGKKIGIQCKKYYMKHDGWNVGEPILRDLYGAGRAGGYDKVMLITTGNFSRQALAWAHGKPDLVLVNAKLLERIILNRGLLKELMS